MLTDDYSFVLNWDDLPPELRDEKIDRYIEYLWEHGDFKDDFDSLYDAQEDKDIREDASDYISRHFPLYF